MLTACMGTRSNSVLENVLYGLTRSLGETRDRLQRIGFSIEGLSGPPSEEPDEADRWLESHQSGQFQEMSSMEAAVDPFENLSDRFDFGDDTDIEPSGSYLEWDEVCA